MTDDPLMKHVKRRPKSYLYRNEIDCKATTVQKETMEINGKFYDVHVWIETVQTKVIRLTEVSDD